MSDLETVLAGECAGMTNEQALAHVKSKTVVTDGMAQSGKVLSYIAQQGQLSTFRAVSDDETNPLSDAADAAIVTLETREGFDFAYNGALDMLAAFVASSIITQEESDYIRAIGQTIKPEFPSTRMIDIQNIRGAE